MITNLTPIISDSRLPWYRYSRNRSATTCEPQNPKLPVYTYNACDEMAFCQWWDIISYFNMKIKLLELLSEKGVSIT
jgi:hypothetical protein